MVNRIRKAMDERDQGFTLIELLVVIIIIGILAAIAIPVFLNQRKKGVDASLKSDLKNAATSVETWATDNPTGSATVGVVTGVDPDFKASDGNTVLIATSGPGVYTLTAENAGSTGGAGQCLTYDSENGGLQKGFVAC